MLLQDPEAYLKLNTNSAKYYESSVDEMLNNLLRVDSITQDELNLCKVEVLRWLELFCVS